MPCRKECLAAVLNQAMDCLSRRFNTEKQLWDHPSVVSYDMGTSSMMLHAGGPLATRIDRQDRRARSLEETPENAKRRHYWDLLI